MMDKKPMTSLFYTVTDSDSRCSGSYPTLEKAARNLWNSYCYVSAVENGEERVLTSEEQARVNRARNPYPHTCSTGGAESVPCPACTWMEHQKNSRCECTDCVEGWKILSEQAAIQKARAS